MVAVTFGWPFHAPTPAPGRSNKILWVAQAGSGPLHIDATEQATGQTFSVTLPDGPGPSTVDVPKPGCWRFALTWANNNDELFVRYFGQALVARLNPGESSAHSLNPAGSITLSAA